MKIRQIFSSMVVLVLLSITISAHANNQSILVLGDSISAAYGIPSESGWVALLDENLPDDVKVVNASVSGETTDGGLRALPDLLDKHKPDIVIVELGANDGLRGFPLPTIERNLNRLVKIAKSASARVLLLGMRIPPNYGARYAEAFHQLYTKVAEAQEVSLVPFLLEDVAINSELMQEDGLHPTADAQPTMRDLVWQKLKPLLSGH